MERKFYIISQIYNEEQVLVIVKYTSNFWSEQIYIVLDDNPSLARTDFFLTMMYLNIINNTNFIINNILHLVKDGHLGTI